VRRREFIMLLGGAAAAWPLAARAQSPGVPVIGFLDVVERSNRLAEFNSGLVEIGYVEGQNVAIEFRSAGNRYDRFPQLVAELVQRNVAIIATLSTPAALAAKAATTTIPIVPIVFITAADPVRVGLVASLARPGGNATGITFFSAELAAKQLGLLRELVPAATRIAVLVNPADATRAETTARDVEAAARVIGLEIHLLEASTSGEIDAAFARIAGDRTNALFVAADGFFNSRRVQLATLATRYAIPATYAVRDYAEAGGLMSYGASIPDALRQAGVYTGRILKGEKPSDLPVLQPTKFEFVINLQTAKAIGLEIPPTLLARADEVIE
jgi:ABC-type uncharacterized transport system substrate-binding protein